MEEMKEVREVREVLITKRDREMMRWVNCVGFATIGQIAEKMGMSNWAVYKRVKKLVRIECLAHHRIYHGLPGIYCLTSLGAECVGSHLPALRMISKATYDHDLVLTQLVIKLSKTVGGELTTERELRYQKTQDGIGQFGHIADAEIMVDNKKIAIEVELTKKGNRRLKKIINDYTKNFDINEVWYFCANNQIKKQVSAYKSNCSFLKVFDLDVSDVSACDITLEKNCA